MQAVSDNNPPDTGTEADRDPPTTTDDDLPELGDRGKWDAEVVETWTTTYEWGTHEFGVEIWVYGNEDVHMTLDPPEGAVACYDEIVRDWAADDDYGHSIAARLICDDHNVDPAEVL